MKTVYITVIAIAVILISHEYLLSNPRYVGFIERMKLKVKFIKRLSFNAASSGLKRLRIALNIRVGTTPKR